MEIPKSELRSIIREEIKSVLKEQGDQYKVKVIPWNDYFKNNPSELDGLARDFRGEKVGEKTYVFPSFAKLEDFQDEVMHFDPKAGFKKL